MEDLDKTTNKIIKGLKKAEKRILAGKEPKFFLTKRGGKVSPDETLFWCNILENKLKEEKGNERLIKVIGLLRKETLKRV